MKKFTFKGVLDGFRSSVSQPSKSEPEWVETLKAEHFQLARTARHGFPHQPTALAYDPIQRLVAIGTKSGAVRIMGRPGASVQIRHEAANEPSANSNSAGSPAAAAEGSGRSSSVSNASGQSASQFASANSGSAPVGAGSGSGSGPAVLQMQFLINEGALVTATADDSIHLWNIRHKKPEIVHSLKFQRERIICFHLPFQSKYLYVGTERGNIHVVNIDSFTISGYVINWNKAIDLCCTTHPGSVIHLSDCPTDPSKLLIGYESGLVVLWDLRTKTADSRFQGAEPLRSVSWLSDGKQLMTAHADGSTWTWNSRAGPKPPPVAVTYPHAKNGGKEGKPEACKPIQKIDWKSTQSGETFVIFSGGLPQDRPGRSSSISVVHGRNTTVLEMEHNVVDFITLCQSPWPSETQDPHSIVVLLQNDVVMVDLLTPGFPCYENPYPMDIHESAVTCCLYLADCPGDLIPVLYSVGAQGHRPVGFSEREWPISGGQWGALAPSYAELIITGHADGTVKFWDSSSLSLQVLYRLKTAKVFEKARAKTLRSDSESTLTVVETAADRRQQLAVQQMAMCSDNRLLAVAGASGHVILFKFRRQEANFETTVLHVPLFFDSAEDPLGSPSYGSGSGGNMDFSPRKEQPNPLKVKTGVYRRPAGFQADMVCLSCWMDGEPPGLITALSVNSAYGLMAYGNDGGLVVIDMVQKSVLLSMGSMDLYSSADPYTRLPRSPKRPGDDECRSPSTDQSRNGSCVSPTSTCSGAPPGGGGGGSGGGGVGGASGSSSSGVGGVSGRPNRFESCSSMSSDASGGGGVAGAGGTSSGGGGGAVIGVGRRPDAVRRSKSQDKSDSAFTRSRSSSTSSLETGVEAVTSLTFADTLARKLDTAVSASLWVGTSQGSVLVILINLAAPGEPRLTQPVMVSPSGSIFRLKGSLLCVSFMDGTGAVMGAPSEPWRDESRDAAKDRFTTPTRSSTPSTSTQHDGTDNQYAVMVSTKQTRVVSLPSQTCIYRLNMAPENCSIVSANVISLKDGACITSFLSSGHIQVLSLPSLRVVLHVEFSSMLDLNFQNAKPNLVDPMLNIWAHQSNVNEDNAQIARNFRFSNHGHGMYLCSPSEIEKFTLSTEFVSTLTELIGELFIACEMPEPPKAGFFQGLFGGGVRSLDREELFGESSTGKGIRGVARHIPGTSNLENLNAKAGTVAAEVQKTRQALNERGERLGLLQERTERMANEAEAFSNAAHQLMVRCRERKWYQL